MKIRRNTRSGEVFDDAPLWIINRTLIVKCTT